MVNQENNSETNKDTQDLDGLQKEKKKGGCFKYGCLSCILGIILIIIIFSFAARDREEGPSPDVRALVVIRNAINLSQNYPDSNRVSLEFLKNHGLEIPPKVRFEIVSADRGNLEFLAQHEKGTKAIFITQKANKLIYYKKIKASEWDKFLNKIRNKEDIEPIESHEIKK